MSNQPSLTKQLGPPLPGGMREAVEGICRILEVCDRERETFEPGRGARVKGGKNMYLKGPSGLSALPTGPDVLSRLDGLCNKWRALKEVCQRQEPPIDCNGRDLLLKDWLRILRSHPFSREFLGRTDELIISMHNLETLVHAQAERRSSHRPDQLGKSEISTLAKEQPATTAEEAVRMIGREWATYRELACVTGKSELAVKSSIHRAIDKEHLEGCNIRSIQKPPPGTARVEVNVIAVWPHLSK